MKRLFSIIVIAFCGLSFSQFVFGQDTPSGSSVRDRIANRQNQGQQRSGLPPLSVRAENMNKDQTQEIGDAPWVREIYRELDLTKDQNSALYYPELPVGDRMNFFTMAFKLILNGDIDAYEYLTDGRELFTDANKLKVKSFLDDQSIMYTEENGKFIVSDYDIPSNEVQKYYVKEAWYFDKNNSVVDVKILAVCPVMYRQDDFGIDSAPYPLFWLPYENVRMYAQRMPIMSSNLNNAMNQTIDDYFRKRSYKGDIYKTTNMRNLSLQQTIKADSTVPMDSLMKKEREKIENQLIQFNKNLWVTNDTVKVEEEKSKTTVRKTTENDKSSTTAKRGQPKVQSAPKAEKAKSTPTRSMRNRRK